MQGAHDLTAIKGIGPTRHRWLRDTFGVKTFDDLANLSADQIEAQLKEEGQIVSRSTIEMWITQAKELGGQQRHEALEPETAWKPFASFVVEFQERATAEGKKLETRVHHIETDQSQVWAGIQQAELADWIINQLPYAPALQRLPTPRTAASYDVFSEKLQTMIAKTGAVPRADHQPEAQPAPPAKIPSPLRVGEALDTAHLTAHVSHVHMIQLTPTPTPHMEMAATKTFTLRATLQVSGMEALMRGPTGFTTDFYAYELTSGALKHLGSTPPGVLVPDQTTYELILPEVSLAPGIYRLQVVAKFEGVPVMGYLEMPILQVM
jgi:hypothetical protein